MIPHWDITVISTPAEYLICVIRVQWKEIICVVVISCSVNFWASEKDVSLKGGVWVETDNPFAYFFLLLFCFCSLFPTNPRVDTERRKSNKRISGGTDPSKYQVMYVKYPTHLKWTAIVVLTKFLFYRETTTLKKKKKKTVTDKKTSRDSPKQPVSKICLDCFVLCRASQ